MKFRFIDKELLVCFVYSHCFTMQKTEPLYGGPVPSSTSLISHHTQRTCVYQGSLPFSPCVFVP